MINFNDKKVKRACAAITLLVVVAMVATAILPALMV